MKANYIYFLLVLFSVKANAQGDTGVPDHVLSNLEQYAANHQKEIVYLQTSKGIYETEEAVWFKGYVLDSQLLVPSAMSKTLFVQLIEDRTDKSVWEEKYEIEGGFVDGHLYLNDSLRAGSYTLAAYSTHSLYEGTNVFHGVRKLEILKNIKHKQKREPVKNDSTLNFNTFPEGGDLVSGIQSRLAFKAENSKGVPVDVSGVLYENNVPLVKFKSAHDGMGSFLFLPNSLNRYHIQLTEPLSNKTYDLPQVLPGGKTLRLLKKTKDQAVFKVSQTANLKEETIYLKVEARGVIYNVAIGRLKRDLIIKIPLKDIPSGIARVTLFDENIKPQAERLMYVNSHRKLTIRAVLDKSEYQARDKAVLKLKVTDQNNKPVIAHLGLGVFDKLYQNELDPKNIMTHYYLSAQLKGNIYNPTYYFNEANKNREGALNLLLLTQGWRRYIRDEPSLKEGSKQIKPLLSDSITGVVRLEKKTKRPKISGQQVVMVFASNSLRGKDIMMTDPKGFFIINHKHLKMGEKGYVYVKPMTPEKPKYVIDIKDPSFDIISSNRKNTPISYPLSKLKDKAREQETEPFIVSNELNQLEEIVLSTNKKQVFRDKYLGRLDSLAKLEMNSDYVGIPCGTLNCQAHPNDKSKKPIEGKVYYYMEGFKWNDKRNAYTITGSGYLKYQYPELTESYLLKKFNLKMLKSFYGKREFYEPVYDKAEQTNVFPDYRNTLLWKPDIITNEKGEADIIFYCSDINTKFIGIVEGVGLSAEGLLGMGSFEFFVRKRK